MLNLTHLIILISTLLSPHAWGDVKDYKITICSMDKGFGNKTNPMGTGEWQTRFTKAFKSIPLTIEYYQAPRARCLQDIKNHKDNAIYAAFTKERESYLSFPRNEDATLNHRQSIDALRFNLYKSADSNIDWNGFELTHADHHRILIQQGIQVEEISKITSGFQLIEVKSVAQILNMLEKKRATAAIIAEEQVVNLIKDKPSLSPSKLPAYIAYVYMAFDQDFYAKDKKLVERIWKAIEETTTSSSLVE